MNTKDLTKGLDAVYDVYYVTVNDDPRHAKKTLDTKIERLNAIYVRGENHTTGEFNELKAKTENNAKLLYRM